VSSKNDLLRLQRRWADARGVRYDARGFVRALADNLHTPLAPAARAELERGSGLAMRGTVPARIHALTSSAALVVNVFGYWRERSPTPLVAALGFGDGDDARLTFEEPLPTELPGEPPFADVALHWPNGDLVPIESKFTEWLVRRPHNKRVFKDKYFPAGAGAGSAVWSAVALPRCQALAEDLQAGRERSKYLNVPQLLKHALGSRKLGQRRTLVFYLYYEWPGREAEVHRFELERVRERLGVEVDLRVLTYQQLFASLRAAPGVDRDYLDYLAERYFRA
jgi:hypothetical protein